MSGGRDVLSDIVNRALIDRQGAILAGRDGEQFPDAAHGC